MTAGLGARIRAGVTVRARKYARALDDQPVLYDAVGRAETGRRSDAPVGLVGLVMAVSGSGFALICLVAPITAALLAPEYASGALLLPWIRGVRAAGVQMSSVMLFATGRPPRFVPAVRPRPWSLYLS